MTDWQLQLNREADEAKNDPEKIKALVKKHIYEFVKDIYSGNRYQNLNSKIEDAISDRGIDDNENLFLGC